MRSVLASVIVLGHALVIFSGCMIFNGQGSGNHDRQSILVIIPIQDQMHCNIRAPHLKGQEFVLTIPESITARRPARPMFIVNHPDVKPTWIGDAESGIVKTSVTVDKKVSYEITHTPFHDYVETEITITNLSNADWHGVSSFNCMNPVRAPKFKNIDDEKYDLGRTFLSRNGEPTALTDTKRKRGPRPSLGVYIDEDDHPREQPWMIHAFDATSDDRTDGTWMLKTSDDGNAYMATLSSRAAYLFNNTEYGCIHSAPDFGKIEPGKSKTIVCRFYFALGTVSDFLERAKIDREYLEEVNDLAER